MKFSAVFLLVLVFAILYVECEGRSGEKKPKRNRDEKQGGNNGHRGNRNRDNRRGSDNSRSSSESEEEQSGGGQQQSMHEDNHQSSSSSQSSDDSNNQESGDDSNNQESDHQSSSSSQSSEDSNNQESGEDSNNQESDQQSSSSSQSSDDSNNQESDGDYGNYVYGDDSSNQESGDDSSNQESGDDSSNQESGDDSSNQESGDDSSNQESDSGSGVSVLVNLEIKNTEIKIEDIPNLIVLVIEVLIKLLHLNVIEETTEHIILAVFTNVEECLNITVQASIDEETIKAALQCRICLTGIFKLLLDLEILVAEGITDLLENVFMSVSNVAINLIEDVLPGFDTLVILGLIGQVPECLKVEIKLLNIEAHVCFEELIKLLGNVLHLVVSGLLPNNSIIKIEVEISDIFSPEGNILELKDILSTLGIVPTILNAATELVPGLLKLVNGVLNPVTNLLGPADGLLGGLLGGSDGGSDGGSNGGLLGSLLGK